MKKATLTLAIALVFGGAVVLGLVGCQDISSDATTSTATSETTTTSAGDTTTTAVDDTTTTSAGGANSKAAPSTTTTLAAMGALADPAPKTKLLKGTWAWDVDGDADGAGSDSDVWYRIVSEVEHYVEPQNGAAFARISKPFSAVTRSDLQGAKYGSGRLATEGVDDPDVLNVGDVIALRTNTGQYAKIEIVGFEAYTLSDGMTYPRYNVRLRYVLYPR